MIASKDAGVRLVALEVENFRRLKAVRLTFDQDDHVLCVGGRNAQGKTSLLDAIEKALRGGVMPTAAVHHGASKARIVARIDGPDLEGPLVIERRFTAKGGTSLVIKGADGNPLASPQAMLDTLVGPNGLAFDPQKFSEMSPRDQADTLAGLVGIDLVAYGNRRKAAYDERTAVNRSLASVEARLSATEYYEDAPKEEVSLTALAGQLEDVHAHNAAVLRARQAVLEAVNRAGRVDADITQCEKERDDLLARLDVLEQKRAGLLQDRIDVGQALIQAHRTADGVVDQDPNPIRQQMGDAEAMNAKVRANKATVEMWARVESLKDEVGGLTGQIEDVDRDKRAALAAAKFPVEGLSFDDDGNVTFNGFVFAEASQAERLRVSFAMALAQNPALRLALIRDGSHLDDDALRLVAELAEAADALVLIERVGKGKECGIIIEGGEVEAAE